MNVITKIANKIIDIFSEGYLLLGFISLVLLFSLGTGLILGLGLFTANKLSPELTSALDEKVTIQTFHSLMNHRQYRAAALLLEEKGNVVNSSPDQAGIYFELGNCYKNIGDYTKAKQCLIHVLNCANEGFETNNDLIDIADRATILWNINYELYSIARITSSYREQKQYSEELSDLLMSIPESDTNYYRYSLLSKITSCEVSHYENSELAINNMKSIISQSSKGSYSPATLLSSLATLIDWELADGDTISALGHLDSACRLAAIVPSEELMDSFGQLSRACYKLGEQEKGGILLKLYSKRIQKSLGTSSLESLASAISLMRFEENDMKWEVFLQRLDKQCALLRSSVQNSIVGMTEDQREYMASILDEPFTYVLDLLSRKNDPKLAEICYKNHLFRKGLLLSSTRSERNSVYNNQDSRIIEKYESLMSKRKLLMAYSESSILTDRSKAKKLKEDIIQLEEELSSVLWKEMDKQGTPDISEICAAIPNSILLDYIEDDNNIYVFSINVNSRYPNGHQLFFSQLCNKSELNSFLSSAEINDIYRSGNLSKLVLPELDFTNIPNIVYSPSASMNRIAFHALKDFSGHYLVDQHNIRLISSSSLLINDDDEYYYGKTASLWGGIDYSKANIKQTKFMGHRGIHRGDTLSYLPYSYAEVDAISNTLRNQLANIEVFKGFDATEKSFREKSGKCDYVMHVSTHGFFIEDSKFSISSNPLYNAGLFFAGANDAWTNELSRQDLDNDGILRASDIALMNLDGCHLAVLSACETGLATHATGDGIFGLQRAFKIAGVDKVVMSLWNVSDSHTSELMENFYDGISNGQHTDEAFDAAVRYMRRQYPNAPEYWAGFVLLN